MSFLDLKRFRLIVFIFIMVMVISGCSGAFPTIQAGQLEPALSTEDQTTERVSEEVETVVASPALAQSESAPVIEEKGNNEAEHERPSAEISDIAPTDVPAQEVVQEPKVVVREQLVATDPATVSLASGQVQLVEFFAFW